jgi:signal transduction histidine kinase
MDSIVFHRIFSFLIIALSFAFGLWVYLSDKNSKKNRFFLLLAVSVAFWIFFYYLTITATSTSGALFWSKLAYGTVSIFYIPFYLFFIYFLNLEKKLRNLSRVIFLFGIIFFVISVFTNSIVKSVFFKDGKVDLILNSGSIAFYSFAMILSLIVIFFLFKRYFSVSYNEKLKTQYFLSGIFIWIFMNFTFNMFLPVVRHSVQYAEFGNYSAVFLLAFTAYAIIRENLFGIRVVLTQILVGVIAILLFVQIFDSRTVFEYIWKVILFLVFLIFGYLLIKSVLREIKLREQLENAYSELKKLDVAKSEFMSIASHQLRTPLTAIKGYISMILDGSYGPVPTKMKGKIINVFESSERLIRLVNDLLSVSRIEAGKIELHIQPTSLENIITSVKDVLTLSAKNKKLYVKWEKPEYPLPQLEIDQDKIREVILNLVDNAIKYTQEGGITLSAKNKGNFVLIKISDTGAGLTQEEMAKMFKSFSRGSAGNEFFTEGVGLGLYIARQFVDLHNGRIWAESDGKNKGTTFYIELPVKPTTQTEELIKNF